MAIIKSVIVSPHEIPALITDGVIGVLLRELLVTGDADSRAALGEGLVDAHHGSFSASRMA